MARGNRGNRSIGGAGTGPNLGNDYSRDITRENTTDDITRVVLPHNKQDKTKPGKQPATQQRNQRRREDNQDFDD
jgi:hypothetical protein